MIKATGAMFSLKASGTLKDTLIFSSRGHFTYIRHKKNLRRYTDVQTEERMKQRTKFQLVKDQWLGLDADTKEWYKRQAVSLAMTGYNYFIKKNIGLPYGNIGLPYSLPFYFE